MSSPPHDGYLTGTDRSRNRPYSQGLSFTPRQEAPLPPVDPQRSRPAGVGISFSFQPGSSSARVSAVSKHVQAIHSDRRGLTVAAGDTLIGVNGRDVSGFPPILLREELLGPAGSNVLLRFERGQEGTTVQFEIVAERGFVGQDTTEPPPPPVPPLYHRDVDLKKATVVASRDNFESRLAQARAEVDAARRAQAIAEEGELKMSQENKRLNHLLEHATKTTEELQSANFTRGEEVRSLQMSLLAAQEDVNDGRQSIAWLEDELAKARDVCAAAQHKEAQMLAGREEERNRRSENNAEVTILEASKAEVQMELSKERLRGREEEGRREEAEHKAADLLRRLLASESERQELEGQLWMVEEGSGREALTSAKLRAEAAEWRERSEDLEAQLEEAEEQKEAAEIALEGARKREEKAVKALEEVRSKGGEQARGREAAERERDALNVELRRVSRVCCQLRDKVGALEISRARMQAEKVALAVRLRDLEEEIEADQRAGLAKAERERERGASRKKSPESGTESSLKMGREREPDAKGRVPFKLFDDEPVLSAPSIAHQNVEGGRERGQSPAARRESPSGVRAGGGGSWTGSGGGRSVRWDGDEEPRMAQGRREQSPGGEEGKGSRSDRRGGLESFGVGGVPDGGWGRLMAGESGWDGWKVTGGELKVTRPPSPPEELVTDVTVERTVEAQRAEDSGEDVGVGINAEHDDGGGLRVSEVVEGMSGHLSGAISVGDEVVQVDGRPVHGLSIEEVARRVKGKDGTPVQLTLRTVKQTHGFAKSSSVNGSGGKEGSKSVARDWEVTLLRGSWDYVDYFDKGAATYPMSPRSKRSPSHRM